MPLTSEREHSMTVAPPIDGDHPKEEKTFEGYLEEAISKHPRLEAIFKRQVNEEIEALKTFADDPAEIRWAATQLLLFEQFGSKKFAQLFNLSENDVRRRIKSLLDLNDKLNKDNLSLGPIERVRSRLDQISASHHL